MCVSPPFDPSHPSHLGKIESKLGLKPSQSRHKRVTPPVTKQGSELEEEFGENSDIDQKITFTG
jgi:hypothetical protein